MKRREFITLLGGAEGHLARGQDVAAEAIVDTRYDNYSSAETTKIIVDAVSQRHPAHNRSRLTNGLRLGFWEISAKTSKLPWSLQKPPFSLLLFLGGGR